LAEKRDFDEGHGAAGKDAEDVNRLKEELESELERLKTQYKQQTEDEKRVQTERDEINRERDVIFKDMTNDKARSVAAIVDPFGEIAKGKDQLPEISGPPEQARRGLEMVKEETRITEAKKADKKDSKVKGPDIDFAAKTDLLRKKLKREPDKEKSGTPREDDTTIGELKASEISEGPPPKLEQKTAELPDGLSIDNLYENIKNRVEAEFETRLARQQEIISDLRDQLISRDEIESILKDKISKTAIQGLIEIINKDFQKMETKIIELGEEVGFGESLNVSKIPPNILEGVYEATLDDAVKALIRNIGPYDAETMILKILEDIRTQTSGSELFKYEEGKLRITDLAKSLESKSISAKQIQATYSEILNKIMEQNPSYKPKNFRAMLKIKSQEFAVDKASGLSEVLNDIRRDVGKVQSIEDELNERLVELEEARNTLMSDVRVIEQKLHELEAAKSAESPKSDSDDSREDKVLPENDSEENAEAEDSEDTTE
jgi:hypothetical protein